MALRGLTNFNPSTDIPSLEGKIVFVTGGTAGLGAETVKLLAAHNPAHIYFSGRNERSGTSLIDSIQKDHASASLTFIPMDLTSLTSVKSAVKQYLVHERLDILICNAGIMAQPPSLSPDGYEIQFATNHLGHAMLISSLLPTLLHTASLPSADVRVISLSSLGFQGHTKAGIEFEQLDAGSDFRKSYPGGSWIRYAQGKLANILYASALARHHPELTCVSIHPGVVKTPLVNSQSLVNRIFIYSSQAIQGKSLLEPDQGAWNTVWAAAAAKKVDLRNGGFYLPVGVDGWKSALDNTARDEKLAERLWVWTQGVLEKH